MIYLLAKMLYEIVKAIVMLPVVLIRIFTGGNR
jgi:hypothetical protein